jgi:hypothetical protein
VRPLTRPRRHGLPSSDNRHVEAWRDGHSDGAHAHRPAGIFSSTVQLGAQVRPNLRPKVQPRSRRRSPAASRIPAGETEDQQRDVPPTSNNGGRWEDADFAVDLNRNVRSPTQVRRSTGKSLANGAHSPKLDGSGASTLDAGWSMASTRASSGPRYWTFRRHLIPGTVPADPDTG